MPVTVMPADADTALPAKLMHLTDVAVVQLLVEQSAVATAAATVVSEGAKFVPINVTVAVTETALYGESAVRTGAARKTP